MRRSRMMLRTLSDRTTGSNVSPGTCNRSMASSNVLYRRTLIFAYVLEGKRQAGVFSFDDSYFAKGSFADDPQEAKVIEADCV